MDRRLPCLRNALLAIAVCVFASPSRADDLWSNGLPTFAREPQGDGKVKKPWEGLYAGAGISVVSGKGKGRVGADGYVGYNREFDNHVVLGVRASAGYAPALFGAGNVKGFDFAMTDVKVGYDFGRVMPYVTAGIGLAKPNRFAFSSPNPADSLNNVFNGSGTRTLTTVGAGVDVAITNNLTVGVAVSAVQARGGSPFAVPQP